MKIRLSWLLLAIGVIALLLGGMREPSIWFVRVAVATTYFGYLAATLLAALAGRRRPGLLGGVLFGWAYLVPVFGVEVQRWVDVAPTTATARALAIALVARPALAPGERFEVRDDDGQLKATYSGGAGDPAKVDCTTVSIREDQGDRPLIGVRHNQGAGFAPLSASAHYVGRWGRAVTLGHLLVALACSCGGAILGVVFEGMLRRAGAAAGPGAAAPRPGRDDDQGLAGSSLIR